MPRGQKNCPKCSKAAGPRTKVCECGYVYLHDSVDKVIDGIEVSAKVGKKKCSNCSKEMISESYNTDPYGKITYYYKYDSYCDVSCLEAASERKDDLISEFLKKFENLNSKDFNSIEEIIENLNSFLAEKRNEDDYSSLIEDVEKRAIIEAENDEYRRTHPYIVHVTNPIKRITTPEECREAGLEVPPKANHIPLLSNEEDDNPLRRLLKSNIPLEEDEESDEEENNNEEEIEESSEENSLAALLEKPSSLSNLLSGLGKTPQVAESSGFIYDNSSRPRQGQKKCRGKCGMIVGVRTKVCPKCNYQF